MSFQVTVTGSALNQSFGVLTTSAFKVVSSVTMMMIVEMHLMRVKVCARVIKDHIIKGGSEI